MSVPGVDYTSHYPPDTRYTDLQQRLKPFLAEAERNARSGSLEYDERTRWRRFAQQLQGALK